STPRFVVLTLRSLVALTLHREHHDGAKLGGGMMTNTETFDPGGAGSSSAIGDTGVWIRTDAMTARETAELSRRVEALGYGAFWFPEITGRNAFVQAGWLLAATERLHVATGIANIFLREPYATATAQRTLAEQSEG